MSKVLDDAREKIAKSLYDEFCPGPHNHWDSVLPEIKDGWLKRADRQLAISGTKDIECPANGCVNGKYMMHDKNYTCRLCLGTGTIKSKWELEVRQVIE